MNGKHIVNQIRHPELRSDNTLHVVVPFMNPVRYHSRYRLGRECLKRLEATPNVKVYVAEAAFADRFHEMTEEGHAQHLRVRTKSEVWIKENLINLAVRYLLPRDWKYVAWVDGDTEFDNPHWALDTIHELQHWPIVQPWESAVNLGPTGRVAKHFDSVGYKVMQNGIEFTKNKKKYSGDPYIFGHCGYAWACTRAFWENVGGLIDFAILGSGDHHMALGCRGYYSHSVHSAVKGPFMDLCHAWQTRSMQITHGVVGRVPGNLKHYFHGPMQRRDYVGRWGILIKNGYDPVHDLRHDEQGVVQIVGKPLLEHDVRMYNRRRLEDSIEEY